MLLSLNLGAAITLSLVLSSQHHHVSKPNTWICSAVIIRVERASLAPPANWVFPGFLALNKFFIFEPNPSSFDMIEPMSMWLVYNHHVSICKSSYYQWRMSQGSVYEFLQIKVCSREMGISLDHQNKFDKLLQ